MAPAIAAGLISAAPSILGGIAGIFGKHKAKKEAEERDYQEQMARQNAMMAHARAGMGRSKFIGSLLKAYGMDSVLGADYFNDQNIMNRRLDALGYQAPTRHNMGGGAGVGDWVSMLGNAAVTGAGTYLGSKQAAADRAQASADKTLDFNRYKELAGLGGSNPAPKPSYGPMAGGYQFDPNQLVKSANPWG